MRRYVLGITGASGPVIGLRVLERLLGAGHAVHLVMTRTATGIIRQEVGPDLSGGPDAAREALAAMYPGGELLVHPDDDMHAPIASGSFRTDGMFIAPCSMKTLSSVAHGHAAGLVERAADVTLKEGRPLVISPREMPLSAIHLENMLALARLGVRVAPPIPAFYNGPRTLDDMIGFLAGRILDAMGVEHSLYKRWS